MKFFNSIIISLIKSPSNAWYVYQLLRSQIALKSKCLNPDNNCSVIFPVCVKPHGLTTLDIGICNISANFISASKSAPAPPGARSSLNRYEPMLN